MNKPRVRFAPSPTGFMHIGNFRSALYDYLFAKKNGGEFVLRIEDTDQKRFVPDSLESIIKVLDWAGLSYDEGVCTKDIADKIENHTLVESKNYPGIVEVGEYGPYVQSEKLETYKEYAEKLMKSGNAYHCFCTPKRLDEMRKEQQALKKPPIYDRCCLKLSIADIKKNLDENKPYTIRLKIPRDEIIGFEDIIRGKIKFNTNIVDDQVLLKSDSYPTYHLANVVDDHNMKITHVIRGEEWLSSVPKHLLLYKYLGWEPPQFAHVPLLLNTDRSKLSKRQGDVAVEDYVKKGYLKESIINFVVFLGWNPGDGSTQEIFTLDELVEKFDLARVHKGGAVFDIQKLDWINAQWIKKLPIDELYDRSLEFWKQKDFYTDAPEEKKYPDYIKKVLSIERDRLSRLDAVGESNKFFFEEIDYDKKLLRWKEMTDEDTKKSLEKSLEIISNVTEKDWTRKNLEKVLFEAAGDKRGELLWPLRSALTGEQKSPSPFEVAWVLGKNQTLERISSAVKKLSA